MLIKEVVTSCENIIIKEDLTYLNFHYYVTLVLLCDIGEC